MMDNLSLQIANEFEIRDRVEVNQLLDKRPDLLPLLSKIPTKARLFFGPDVGVALRVIHEPEDQGYDSLVVIIKSKMEVAETLDCLDAFDEEWWIEASSKVNSNISVITEYEEK